MRWLIALFFLRLLSAQEFDDIGGVFNDEDESFPKFKEEEVPVVPQIPPYSYVKPSSNGFVFLETFDEDVFDRWTRTSDSKFNGDWMVTERKTEGITDDKGLRTMHEARHHAVYAKLPEKISNSIVDQDIAVSYEVKFEEGLQCGGAYLKFFDSKFLEESKFTNTVPYVIMFGPDKCGGTNKVHLIIKKQNPINGEWEEHHLNGPPRLPFHDSTHQYGFHLRTDDTFTIYIDGKDVRSGDMKTEFNPPFTPEAEIFDSEDFKPEDWDERETVVDPEAQKPEDWDDFAERYIDDPKVEMPEGWREDLPSRIVDKNAAEPYGWDEEEDGVWEAPLTANPECEDLVGCGPWTPPKIPNPKWTGPWQAPHIPNPDYQGQWTPRVVANPNYFVDEHPHVLAEFDAIGFELWAMQSGIIFDNIAVARSQKPIKEMIDVSWAKRFEVEESIRMSTQRDIATSLNQKLPGKFERVMIFMAEEKGLALTTLTLICSTLFLFLRYLQRSRKSKKIETPVEETSEATETMKSKETEKDENEAKVRS